jgi:hypothetical protein
MDERTRSAAGRQEALVLSRWQGLEHVAVFRHPAAIASPHFGLGQFDLARPHCRCLSDQSSATASLKTVCDWSEQR